MITVQEFEEFLDDNGLSCTRVARLVTSKWFNLPSGKFCFLLVRVGASSLEFRYTPSEGQSQLINIGWLWPKIKNKEGLSTEDEFLLGEFSKPLKEYLDRLWETKNS